MRFSIKLNERVRDWRLARRRQTIGLIQIGDFEESFEADLTYWKSAQYKHHWRIACKRLLASENAHSALITSMIHPRRANFITWWPLYREGDIVHVQNQMLLFHLLTTPFCEEDVFRHVRPRERVDDGMKISEWHIPVSAVAEFYGDNDW